MMVICTRPSLILFLHIALYIVVESSTVESYGSQSESQSPQCYNGVNETINGSSVCHCYPGWRGDSCQHCGGKIRLNTTYGTITDGPCQYENTARCLWYLDTPSVYSSIHLLIHSLSVECSWDYLHVFSGGSLYSQKIAAFTGTILEGQDMNATENDTNRISMPMQFISIDVTGPTLLYFYSDAGKTEQGFFIEYWLDCPANCSNHGSCDPDGSCDCDAGWTGELCNQETCPSNCSGNGQCDLQAAKCVCSDSYTGVDCSEKTPFIQWSKLNDNSSSSYQWGSGSHSNVQWNESLWLFGGYQFPEETSSNDTTLAAPLWRYGLDLEEDWELIEPQEWEWWPSARYDHSAVVYEDMMIVFGGVLVPSERFTTELLTYFFLDNIWEVSNSSGDYNDTIPTSSLNTSCDNMSADYDGYDVLMEEMCNSSASSDVVLPLPVRGHTAHVIGNKMLVFFGLVRASDSQPGLLQELDLDNMTWSVPPQSGEFPTGRYGHTSVYSEELGVVYVYGGKIKNTDARDDLMMFNVTTYTWYKLPPSPQQLLFHSSVLLDHLMVVFAGDQFLPDNEQHCFSNNILTYDTACRRWSTFEFSGSPLGIGRRGHTTVAVNGESAMLVFGGYDGQILSDVLKIQFSNCSILANISECVLGSVGLCAWHGPTNSCIEAFTVAPDQLELHCATTVCLLRGNYNECVADMGCQWEFDNCVPSSNISNDNDNIITNATSTPVEDITEEEDNDICTVFTGCDVCLAAGCSFVNGDCVSGPNNESVTMEQCLSGIRLCYDQTSCSSCVADDGCLWCASLHRCVQSNFYPHLYPYGQCLGWQNQRSGNARDNTCSEITDCDANSYLRCQSDIFCGWCYSPEETGLGLCTSGGFSGPRDSCPGADWTWFYDEAPLCNCNGHSTCENGSVCISCSDNTTGEHCEYCDFGYTGDPSNGQLCDECDCNGFGIACHNQTGMCYCNDYGVSGEHCTNCTSGAKGSVDDYCFFELDVGYSYTITIDSRFIQRASFVTFPETKDDLQLEVEVRKSGFDLYIYGGRVSQGLYQLENLENVTGPTRVTGEVKYTIKDDDFGNDDLGLLIYADNMYPPIEFKITLKQPNYLFLLYFFAAFCSCFLSLLICFLLIWYIRKKLAYRRFIRAHYRELRQRISRPFTKMNVLVSTKPALEKQRASCIGVEPCGDGKAAVLSMLVQLPGESSSTNKPRHGQSGLCVGSALVKSSRTASEIKQRSHNATQRNMYRNVT